MNKIYALIISLLSISITVEAQLCSDPIQVCYNNPVSELNTGGALSGSNTFCFPSDNSIYFSVTTNASGGDINVSISDVNCSSTSAGGVDLFQGLEAVLFEVDPNSPCNQSAYNELICSPASDTEINLSYGVNPSTLYYVMVDGANDPSGVQSPGECEFSIDVSGAAIENDFTAGPDFTVELGEEVTLQASGYGPTVSWTPLSGLFSSPTEGNPTARPSETTNYAITTEIDGCIVSDTMTVNIIPYLIPFNAFTPNKDGYNDTWEIPNAFRFDKMDITVYSRWGQVVYKSIGYSNPWDGSINGKRLPAATYYYVIDLNHEALEDDKNIITGFIAIVY